MGIYTKFPSEVKLSVGTETWLQPWVGRIAMSTKTRKISFDGKAKFHEVSHENDISWVSNCIIHIEWMLMVKWTGYIAAS